jgi:hypothetical protein
MINRSGIWLLYLLCLFTTGTAEELNSEESAATTQHPILYVPTFKMFSEQSTAGTAFVIFHDKQLYGVTAQHLLGLAGGLSRDYAGTDLESQLKKVTFEPLFDGYENLISKQHTPIKTTETGASESFQSDLFITPLKTVDSLPLLLASNPPEPGDKVLLFAAVMDSEDLLHPAIVMSFDEDVLSYVFLNKNLNLRATSGAPVLNEAYEVIGVNLAGGTSPEGHVMGYANPYTTIINSLPKTP